MLDYSNHFQIVTYLIYELILSISILKQSPDVFCIATQPRSLLSQIVQQEYLYSNCTWQQAQTHIGETEPEHSKPQPHQADHQQPELEDLIQTLALSNKSSLSNRKHWMLTHHHIV